MFIIYQKDNKKINELELRNKDIILDNKLLISENFENIKFYNDQCFVKDEEMIIVFNGVLLNLYHLLKKYNVLTIKELIVILYKEDREFFKNFRGNFYGCVYDIEKDELVVFSDHLSNKPLFYFEDTEYLVVSSSVQRIVELLRKDNKLKLNRAGCYSLVTYAYMYYDMTIFDGVKRLVPGWYIDLKNEKMVQYQFYSITNNKKINISIEEAVDRIDELFTNSIKMQIQKNKEYGLKNYAPLSAGLDSRITTMALNRFQAKDIINFTYSETGQLDQKIPMKIARDLGNKWIFKSLDGGLDLFNIDEAIEIGDSLIYYSWPSQLYDFMNIVNLDNMGIIHTGVLGDVIIGTYNRSKEKENNPYQMGDGAYSTVLLEKLKEAAQENLYENYEVGMLYNRAINGVCLGYSTTFSKYTEACSPFMDVDLLDFCFSLPDSYRLQHRIYYKWVEKYYPNALNYSHNGLKISTSRLGINIKKKFIAFDTIPSRVKIAIKNHFNENKGMNPLDFWYQSNSKLSYYMDSYFEKNKKLQNLDDKIYEDVKKLYKTGNAIEKTMAITLVGIIEKSF